MPRLDDRQLAELHLRHLQEANSYLSENKILERRERARRYYDGVTPDGVKDMDGRSTIVDNVTRDTIEWILPSLIRVFTSGDKLISIEGQGEEDVERAERVEAWVNYVEGRINSNFLNDYTWFKDALQLIDGWEQVYWESKERVYRTDYEGLTEADLDQLAADENYEFVEEPEAVPGVMVDPTTGQPVEVTLYNVTGNRIEETWEMRVEVKDPDSVLYNGDATGDRETWTFVSVKSHKTISELREMGLKVEEDINGPELDSARYETLAELEPWDPSEDDDTFAGIDPTLRKVWCYEGFIKCDADGDGIAEWVKVIQVGDEILERAQEPEPNLFHITPVIKQHQLSGLSVEDLVHDLQELMTALNRQVLDNIYQTNDPREEVVAGGMNEHTWQDLLRGVGPIRVDQPGTINPLVRNQLQPWTFSLLEYWEGKREQRAGVTRYNQGMDANSLNKTATGIMQIFQSAQQRVELIARIFAETGVKDKIRYIIDLSARYPEYVDERSIRLQGRKLDISSKDVQGRFDLVINPAIGTGNKQQALQNVMVLMQFYQQAAAAGLGPGSQQALYSLNNLFNAASEMLKAMGWRNVSDFIIDPMAEGAEEARDPVREPPPNPDLVKAEAQAQKDQADTQIKQQEVQGKQQIEMGKLELERERVALEREKLVMEQQKMGQELAVQMAQADGDVKPDNVIDLEDRMRERELQERELLLKERELDARLAQMSRETQQVVGEVAQGEGLDAAMAALGEIHAAVTGPKMFERDAFGRVVSINGAPVMYDEAGLIQGIGPQQEQGEETA